MTCCGQGRVALKSNQALPSSHPKVDMPLVAPLMTSAQPQVTVPMPTVPTAGGSPASQVRIRYSENSPIMVKGAATGRFYHFSSSQPVQTVDEGDARLLLESRFFRQY